MLETFHQFWSLLQGDQDSFVEKVTEICDERLKIGFSKLCARIKPKDKENIDKPKMQSLDDLLKDLDHMENEDFRKEEELHEEEELDSMLDNLIEEEEDIDEDEEE